MLAIVEPDTANTPNFFPVSGRCFISSLILSHAIVPAHCVSTHNAPLSVRYAARVRLNEKCMYSNILWLPKSISLFACSEQRRSSPHFSPAFYCDGGSGHVYCVALRRASRQTVKSASEALGRAPCIHARLHRLVTKPGEKCGLMVGPDGARDPDNEHLHPYNRQN